jgi:hypothetical protein
VTNSLFAVANDRPPIDERILYCIDACVLHGRKSLSANIIHEDGLARPGLPRISVRASSRLARLRSQQAASFLPRPLTGSLHANHQTNNRRFLFPVTFSLNLKRQAPLLGALQLVHAAGQISYLLI